MVNTVEQLIALHEGRKNDVYLDSLGIPTIGIGHNLKAKPLPAGYITPLTDAQVDEIFANDLKAAEDALTKALPWFADLDDVRKAVLVDMAFNMGIAGLLTFKNTLTLIRASKYELAADNMRKSKWASQVGPRAERDAQMMFTGQWPE